MQPDDACEAGITPGMNYVLFYRIFLKAVLKLILDTKSK